MLVQFCCSCLTFFFSHKYCQLLSLGQSRPLTIGKAAIFQAAYPPHPPHAYTAPIIETSNIAILLTQNITQKKYDIIKHNPYLSLLTPHPNILLVYTQYIFDVHAMILGQACL